LRRPIEITALTGLREHHGDAAKHEMFSEVRWQMKERASAPPW